MAPPQGVVALVMSLGTLSSSGKKGAAVALRHLCSAARPGVKPTKDNADKGVMVRALIPTGLCILNIMAKYRRLLPRESHHRPLYTLTKEVASICGDGLVGQRLSH